MKETSCVDKEGKILTTIWQRSNGVWDVSATGDQYLTKEQGMAAAEKYLVKKNQDDK